MGLHGALEHLRGECGAPCGVWGSAPAPHPLSHRGDSAPGNGHRAGRDVLPCPPSDPPTPPRPGLPYGHPRDPPPPRPGHTESRPSSQGGALLDSLQQWGGGHIPELLPPVPPRLHFRKGDSTLGGGARGCPSGSALVLWGGGGDTVQFWGPLFCACKGEKKWGGKGGGGKWENGIPPQRENNGGVPPFALNPPPPPQPKKKSCSISGGSQILWGDGRAYREGGKLHGAMCGA